MLSLVRAGSGTVGRERRKRPSGSVFGTSHAEISDLAGLLRVSGRRKIDACECPRTEKLLATHRASLTRSRASSNLGPMAATIPDRACLASRSIHR